MPIDTSIYNALKPAQIDSPLENYAKVAQFQQMQNQNRLADLTLQQHQRSLASDNALASLLGVGAKGEDVTTGLAKAGFGNAALAYQKQLRDQQKVDAETAKDKATAKKTTLEAANIALTQHRSMLNNVNDINGAAQWLAAGYQNPDTKPIFERFGPLDVALQRLQATVKDPESFQKWKMGASMNADELVKYTTPDANTLANNKTSILTTKMNNDTSRSTNAATNAVAMRGQNMTDARAREVNAQGKVPPGYRQTADGNLQAIPGGPADLKQQGMFNQDTAALTGSLSGFDRLATAANEVLNHPGLPSITGLRGMLPNRPGSDAANAQAMLNTLKSQVGFGVLQDMRNNSKTGGALGAVSDAEGKRLEANLAALENAQSIEQFKSSLNKVIEYANQAKERVRDAYNLKYSGRTGQNPVTSSDTSAASVTVPKAGAVENGYRFKGGNPADPKSWEKV